MAMANTFAPFGFRPIMNADGSAWTGNQTLRKIVATSSTALFYGDLVAQLATGYITVGAASATTALGIFVGCRYVPTAFGYMRWSNWWPGSGQNTAAGDIDAYYETNYQIHEAIQRLAGNRWLSGVVSDLRKVLRLSRHKSLKLPGRIQESCAEHMSVFSALKAHDPEGAEALMKTHVLRQRGALSALDRADPEPPAVAPGQLRLAGQD